MSRPMSRLSSLQARRRLLASAADLHRNQLGKSWSGLREASLAALSTTRVALEETQRELASAGKLVMTATVIWSTIQALRRNARNNGPRNKSGSILSRIMATFRAGRTILEAFRGSKPKAPTGPGGSVTF